MPQTVSSLLCFMSIFKEVVIVPVLIVTEVTQNYTDCLTNQLHLLLTQSTRSRDHRFGIVDATTATKEAPVQ